MRQFSGLILKPKLQGACNRACIFWMSAHRRRDLIIWNYCHSKLLDTDTRDVCGYSHLGRNLQSIAVVLINLYSLYIWWFSPTSTVLPRFEWRRRRLDYSISISDHIHIKSDFSETKICFFHLTWIANLLLLSWRLRRLLAVICVGDQSTQYIHFVVQLQALRTGTCARFCKTPPTKVQ